MNSPQRKPLRILAIRPPPMPEFDLRTTTATLLVVQAFQPALAAKPHPCGAGFQACTCDEAAPLWCGLSSLHLRRSRILVVKAFQPALAAKPHPCGAGFPACTCG